jgi:hypothetical protein
MHFFAQKDHIPVFSHLLVSNLLDNLTGVDYGEGNIYNPSTQVLREFFDAPFRVLPGFQFMAG